MWVADYQNFHFLGQKRMKDFTESAVFLFMFCVFEIILYSNLS